MPNLFVSMLQRLGIETNQFATSKGTLRGLELASPGWAVAGGLFLAVNPLLVTRVVLILQEPMLILTTTLALLASVRWLRVPSAGRAALAGVAWGFCALAKPVVLFAPILLIGVHWVSCRRRGVSL